MLAAFEHVVLDRAWHQQVGVINSPQSKVYARVIKYKHLIGQALATFRRICETVPTGGDRNAVEVVSIKTTALISRWASALR